ncbi:hypothetical protein JKP88DRAFT_336389 [Tribonema minus]|uniref:Uncharacterized protein n=1 Tax=Tribonema minus TaxID=303371 RepID=A0A836C7R5_9STRA|nr:hypothetical protein JKP88DRAFT_336389 [Tribonema minus]
MSAAPGESPQHLTLEDKLLQLRFGYESALEGEAGLRAQGIRVIDQGITSVSAQNVLAPDLSRQQPKDDSPSALCRPTGTRPLGCAPLLQHHFPPPRTCTDDAMMTPLPCVESGVCPFVRFECPRGHTWKAVAGAPACFFCPQCSAAEVRGRRARRRLSLASLAELAAARGGECVSAEYRGLMEPHDFKCAKGHVWSALANNVVYCASWCPTCAKGQRAASNRLSAADMHATAAQFGGEFLSPTYHGADKKHLWRCSAGHTFKQTPNAIRRRVGGKRRPAFCPECSRAQRAISAVTLPRAPAAAADGALFWSSRQRSRRQRAGRVF